jgi:hypothetical protein
MSRQTADEIFRRHGIVGPTKEGQHSTTCPQCSANRKPGHQNLTCLSVKVDGDGVRWHCNHCDWKGGEFFERRSGSAFIAEYIYRQQDGSPYLKVCKTASKQFPQFHWDVNQWVKGKPKGQKIPYRLPELAAAAVGTTVYFCEGEKDANSVAKIGLVGTTASEGAKAKWDPALTRWFKDRRVTILIHADVPGRGHGQKVAKALHGVAASVKVVDLYPERTDGSDVSNWLAADRAGEKLLQVVRDAPEWNSKALEPPVEDDKGDTEDGEKKKKQADILIELASSAELFHDKDDVCYARFDVNKHMETWPIRSKGFKRWLARGYYDLTKSAPSSDAMSAAMGVLEARAQFDAPEHDVCVRVAGHDGRIYIDLADRDWRAIEVDEDGWRVVDDPPVYFRRSAGMKPLPEPVPGGSLELDLRPLLNVKGDNEFVLIVSWLLAAARPHGPYPILDLIGEHGSAKSWMAKLIRAIIDPSSVLLRAPPRNEHDVYIAARNGQVLAYDNLSGLSDWLSDTFCRLATGGGFSTRELYSDQDEVLFGSTRPIILNGIDDIATRPDLADRSIAPALSPISDQGRKLESELWEQFERKHPLILGALLTVISHGLKTLPYVKLDSKPRMADFAVWIVACEGVLWEQGTFVAAYGGNIEEAIEVVLEADQVATVLRSYIEKNSKFSGNASELLEALNGIVPESQRKAKGWPKRPNLLSAILRRQAPPLRKVGIDIQFEREGRKRWVTIIRPDKLGKTSSPASSSSLSSDFNGLEEVGDRHTIVTADGGIVTGDDGDDPDDDPHDGIVTRKSLKDNRNDDDDDHDDALRHLAGSRVDSKRSAAESDPAPRLNTPPPPTPKPALAQAPSGDGLDIPSFLRRVDPSRAPALGPPGDSLDDFK